MQEPACLHCTHITPHPPAGRVPSRAEAQSMSRSITALLAALWLGATAQAADTVEPPAALDTLKQKAGKLLMNVKPFMVEGAYSQFHPLLQSVRENQHLEPVIPRAQQQAQAQGKL